MANMTFKADLLPSSNLEYNLGSTTQEWAVYGILTGTASFASNANYATSAGSASYALNAASATYANSSNCASHAIHAGSATYATSAAQATHSASATFANSTTSASQAIHSASANYAASAAQATHSASAVFASSATKATQDGSGNTITSTYLKLSGGTMTGAAIGKSTASSWINGQKNAAGGWNLTDATDTGSYWPWMRQTNTSSGKWFSMGTLNNSLYIIGSTTSRTENSYDYGWRFDLSNGYLYGNFSGSLSGNASTATKLSNTPSNTTTFLRGDNTWSNTLTGTLKIGNNLSLWSDGEGGNIRLFKNGSTTECTEIDRNSDALRIYRSTNGGGASTHEWIFMSDGSFHTTKGYLKSTLNSNTVTIGSQNTSFCHFINSADRPFYFNKNVHAVGMVKIYDTGTYMSDGSVTIRKSSNPSGNTRGHGISLWEDSEGGNITIYTGNCSSYGSWQWDIDAFNGDLRFFSWDSSGNYHGTIVIDKSAGVLHGACWNDYAEFRETCIEAKPGQCVIENGNDTLSLSTKRCQPGAQIVSDTYGFAIGKVENKYETPLAVSGRVLAYTDVDRYKFKPGQAVCSGPNGTISRMRWYEKILWPERMIGFVSAIPEYEEWGNHLAEVKVNNRIWIRVK